MSHFDTRTACPVCSSSKFETIYSAPYDDACVRGFIETHYEGQGTVDYSNFLGGEYVVCLCHTCDALFQKNIPNDRLLDYIYNRLMDPAALESLERRLITLASVDKIAGELAHLFRLIGKSPADIVMLDYGFGYGRWARVARGMGATVYATEIGEEKRQIAASLGVRIISDADIDRMTFDLVHTEQVLEHLVKPGEVFARLAKASRVLLKAAVPARKNAEDLLKKRGLPAVSPFNRVMRGEKALSTDDAYVSVQPLEHLNAYSVKTMKWLGDQNGMKLISRVRMGSVGVDVSSARRWIGTMGKVGQMFVKSVMQPDKGYFLFQKQ